LDSCETGFDVSSLSFPGHGREGLLGECFFGCRAVMALDAERGRGVRGVWFSGGPSAATGCLGTNMNTSRANTDKLSENSTLSGRCY